MFGMCKLTAAVMTVSNVCSRKPSSFKYVSACLWNLNSITFHDFLKVKLLTGYNVIHKFSIICYISESYFNLDTSSNDDKLNISSYNMSRSDHPSGYQ